VATVNTVLLGQGTESNNYLVSCILYVFDQLQASTSLSRQATVLPLANAYELSVAVSSLVSSAVQSSDAQLLKQVIGGSISSVNSADCTQVHFFLIYM
jgi:hypothetical protein